MDEKKEEYIVVWYFSYKYIKEIAYCKNGEDHYREIPTVYIELTDISDMVLRGGDSLYVSTRTHYIQKLDLSSRRRF